MKNKKTYQTIILSMLFLSFGIGLYSCKTDSKKEGKEQKADSYYTCSMHPQVHQDKPGNCPICNMKLIKVSQNTEEEDMPEDSLLSYLAEPVSKVAVGSFQTIHPEEMTAEKQIRVNGTIEFDKRGRNIVSSRISGRIDEIFVKYENQQINKGQALFKLYSPQLLSYQKDLLEAVKNDNKVLTNKLQSRLINLGMAEKEIQKIINDKKALTDITIYSKFNGIVRNMTRKQSNSVLLIKEGMYIDKGQPLFVVQEISQKWADLNIAVKDLKYITIGDSVSLFSDASGKQLVKGKIDFIPSYFEEENKSVAVRVYLKKVPSEWKIGTFVEGIITTTHSGTFIPKTAVEDLGEKKVIWVKKEKYNNIFISRNIKTGWQNDDFVEVISGLNTNIEIAKVAAYMVEKETVL